jgi:hypothetical protein
VKSLRRTHFKEVFMNPPFPPGDATLSRAATAWFVVDWIVALFPPIHWGMAGPLPDILGVPATLAYFLGVSLFIATSILFAYWVDIQRSNLV